MMREVLLSEEKFPYLLPKAAKRLEEARRLAKKTGIDKNFIINIGGNSFVFFPWLGTKAFQALKRILQKNASEFDLFDIQSGLCYYITFKSDNKNSDQILALLKKKLADENIPDQSLVIKTEYPSFDKFDPCLPHELLIESFAKTRLDLEEVKKKFKTL
jgi:ATP-dependent Lhr-like helicase